MKNKPYYIFLIILLGAILAGNLALGYQEKSTTTLNKRTTIAYNEFLLANQPTALNLPESDYTAISPIPEKTLEEILLPEKDLEMRKNAVCDFIHSQNKENKLCQ